MLKRFALPLCAVALTASFACRQQSSDVSQTAGATPAARVLVIEDGFEITVIDEAPGHEMDIELFDGPLSNEERLSFMPNGKAPAAVNIIMVRIGGKTYMIDAAFGRAVADGRIDPASVDAILVTHEHGDHIGGLLNADGAANFDAPVFISQKEREYWSDAATPNSDLQKRTSEVYGDRYRTFAFGDTLAPGIVAVDAAGHTPGHTAFLIGTGERKLLVAADFLHAAALQFPNPDESARFDIDARAAAETRKRLINMAIDNNWLIAGMHIAGGYGSVARDGSGGFVFTPGAAERSGADQ